MRHKIDDKKKINKHLVITIFLITLLIFFSGIMIGKYVTEKKFEYLAGEFEDMRIQLISLNIQNMIIDQELCKFSDNKILTDNLQEVSERVAFMENTLGWDHPQVWNAKEEFSLLELHHWSLYKKYITQCDAKNKTWALYLYSNKGDCPKCEQQGTILTHIRQENEDFLVYHIDVNLDNPAIGTVKEIYNISKDDKMPILIINDEKYTGLVPLEEVIAIISG